MNKTDMRHFRIVDSHHREPPKGFAPADIEAQIAAFLAAGGKVQTIPQGQSLSQSVYTEGPRAGQPVLNKKEKLEKAKKDHSLCVGRTTYEAE